MALEGGSSHTRSGEDMAEGGGMHLAASVEEADSYLDEVDMGRPHAEDPGLQSARVIYFGHLVLLLDNGAVEDKHYAADRATGREEDKEQVLLDREEGTGSDDAQVQDIGCVRPWLQVSAVNAAGVHSMPHGLDPREGNNVAWRNPFVP